MEISSLTCVYNGMPFLPDFLLMLNEIADEIVIVEGSWAGHTSTYDWKTNSRSTDGSRKICEEFAKSNNKVVLLDSVFDEQCSRNLGLTACSNNWVLQIDADEFYDTDKFLLLKENLKTCPFDIVEVKEYNFVFNYRFYNETYRRRIFNSNIIEFTTNGIVGDVLKKSNNKIALSGKIDIAPMYHFSWVYPLEKIQKNIEKEELNKFNKKNWVWRIWRDEIFLKFNGNNLKELEEKNYGSIHPWAKIDKQTRNHLIKEIDQNFKFPLHIENAKWFDKNYKGLICDESR